mmetsp:Transcript_22285/g.32837  ORF Transcript_22285/g.32837 Transcript_22285/m.32837 type:complete len:514 (+) Transcript_22285:211-1752(+)
MALSANSDHMVNSSRPHDLRERRSSFIRGTNNKKPSDSKIRRRSRPWSSLSKKRDKSKSRFSTVRLVILLLVAMSVVQCVMMLVVNLRQSSDTFSSNEKEGIVVGHVSAPPVLVPGGYISIKMMGYEQKPKTLTLDKEAEKQLSMRVDKEHQQQHTAFARSSIINPEESGMNKPEEEDDDEKGFTLEEKMHNRKKKSAKYNHEPFEVGSCVAMQSWQKMSYPTCNLVHEFDLAEEKNKHVNGGAYRDVWNVNVWDGTHMVVKTLRYHQEFTHRNYDRHRRDALAMERLGSSKHITNMYGYCTNSGIFDLSEFGDLADLFSAVRAGKQSLGKIDRLRIALQVATAISEAHYTDKKGYPTIAHTDIAAKQFILIDGIYQLGDFNRCRFMRWDERKHGPCGFLIASGPGKYRSPEEYAGRKSVLTEKIDVYSMGNIFYEILTNEKPFKNIATKQVRSIVKEGLRPVVPFKVKNSNNQIDIVLMRAMDMCFHQNPKKRPSAKDVAIYLSKQLQKIER